MKKFKGEIEGFPPEVVDWMCSQQNEQGNPVDVSIFEQKSFNTRERGGFDWHLASGFSSASDAINFCNAVIGKRDFKTFFKKFPKKEYVYPMIMWVWDTEEENPKTCKRVVFANKRGKYIAWNAAETFEEAENILITDTWLFAEPFIENETIEVTIDEIAEKFGVNPNHIKIKK